MGVNIAQTTETFGSGDQSWLGSAHGTNECNTFTLDTSAFVGTFVEGVVPSGVCVGVITATGLLGPYADVGAGGLDVATGLLFTDVDISAGVDVPCAVYWHGEVIEDNLPVGHGVTTAAKADLTHIHWI